MAKQTSRGSGFFSGLGGLVAGALGAYYFDPISGLRRRARLREIMIRWSHESRTDMNVAGRDFINRGKGAFFSAKRIFSEESTPDDILVDRVRAKLGRCVSHPHAIHVTAEDGVVTLEGLILSRELDRLLGVVSRLPGVKQVANKLESHKSDDNIPALQGGIPRRGMVPDIFQTKWAPGTRLSLVVIGSVAMTYGIRRRGALGSLATIFGGLITIRAATNMEFAQLVGFGTPRKPISIHKAINISASVETVYAFWSNFENYPRFMKHVREVIATASGTRWHWTVDGPVGMPISWTATVTKAVPNRLIEWRTEPGAAIANSGRAQFLTNPDGTTRVELDFSYTPPAGAFGNFAAEVFGASPKSRITEALYQIKTFLEQGPSERQITGLH